jgi:hypothetical protein
MSFLAELTDFDTDDHPYAISDFSKRYLRTYLLYEGKPALVHNVEERFINFKFLLDKSYKLYHIGAPNLNIQPLLPKVGYYNVQGKPVFLYKNPQKQYKRSFCSSTYTTDEPTLRAMDRTTLTSYWEDLAQATINPDYAHLDELQRSILGYVALNLKFAIQGNILLYRKYPIGILNFQTRTLTIQQPLLMQEVQDLFQYTEVQTWKLK